MDPDQTAPLGTVCSGSTLFSSKLNFFVSNVRQLFAADNFSRRHFQMHFFLDALRVRINPYPANIFYPENVVGFLSLLHIFKCTLDKLITESNYEP